MKKISMLLLLLLLTGCTPRPGSTPPLQVAAPVIEEPQQDPEEELPIYLEELPIVLTILEPNSGGNVFVEAEYINKTEYPITSYTMVILSKDTNEKGYLVSFDTVLPGETSPKFKGAGPKTEKMEDLEKLTLSVIAMTEDEKELYIDYDLKLEMAEWFYTE